MGEFVLVAGGRTEQSRVLSLVLRTRAERAGWPVSDLSPLAWLAISGPHPPNQCQVGPWTLIGDVLHRRNATFPAAITDDRYDYERKLMARFWGRYIGVRFTGAGDVREILRDPSGGLECVTWEQQGVLLACSSAAAWLLDGLALPWRLNLIRLAQAMRDPLISAEGLLLDGPTAIAPGTLQAMPLGAAPIPLWDPGLIASRSLSKSWKVEDAASLLRSSIDEAVAGLAAVSGPIAAEVSGGLDSSIVAGSLVSSGRSPVRIWLNAHGATQESDERVYVRALAEKLDISPTMAPHATGLITETLLERISTGFRPGLNALDLHHDLDWSKRLSEAGAAALLTGKGGDSILLQNASVDVFSDLWKQRRWRALTSPDMARLAARNEVSVWTMLRRVRHDLRGATPRFLRDDALLPPGDEDPDFEHPWLSSSPRFGPAKTRQIAGVIDSVSRHGPSLLTDTVDVRHPMCAQPVIEAGLAIPTPLLTIGGRDRGLARSAFRDRLPNLIAERRSKGDMTRIYGRMIVDNLDVFRTWLLDGELVSAGVLDRNRVEGALKPESLMWHGQFGAIIRAAAFEGWVRVWGRRLRSI